MQLAAIATATPTARPPLVIAHGLFGSARNWGAVAKRLAADRQVVAVDMRNHGDSPRSPDHGYRGDGRPTSPRPSRRLGGRADVLGHSMGGKAAMVLALTEPARVRRLIVADIAPVAYGAQPDRATCAPCRRVDLAAVARRSEADAALAARGARPGACAPSCCRASRIGPDGAAWKLNLPPSPTQMPRDHGLPRARRPLRRPDAVPDRRHAPTTSARSTGRASARSSPPPSTQAIPGAGHWLHADAPARLRRRRRRLPRRR